MYISALLHRLHCLGDTMHGSRVLATAQSVILRRNYRYRRS